MKFPRMPIRCGTFDILYNIFESMNENLLKELSNAIIEVFDKNGNKIEFSFAIFVKKMIIHLNYCLEKILINFSTH